MSSNIRKRTRWGADTPLVAARAAPGLRVPSARCSEDAVAKALPGLLFLVATDQLEHVLAGVAIRAGRRAPLTCRHRASASTKPMVALFKGSDVSRGT